MRHGSASRFAVRTTVDAVLGLVVFLVIAGLLPSRDDRDLRLGFGDFLSVSAAAAEVISSPVSEGAAVVAGLIQSVGPMSVAAAPSPAHRMDVPKTFILLAGIFSALFAFNLGFVRHLRRAYASPR